MKECDNSKNTYKQQLPLLYMSSNNVRHSFVMSICLSAWNNSAPAGLKFIKCDILVIFRSMSKKFITYYYNFSRITCTLREDQYTILIISRPVLLRMRNISDRSCRENQNTHSMLKNFFYKKSCGFCDNVEKYCTAGQATDDNKTHAHFVLDT